MTVQVLGPGKVVVEFVFEVEYLVSVVVVSFQMWETIMITFPL